MNKRDLIDAISGRLGDKKTATEALNAVLETIQSAVASGDKVAITGFGVFEKTERPARTARNPATGAPIQVGRDLLDFFLIHLRCLVEQFAADSHFVDFMQQGRQPFDVH